MTLNARPWMLAGVVLVWCLAMPLGWLAVRGGALPELEPATPATTSAAEATDQIRHGAYLARVGNCAACHTARGGEPFAGGRGIHTPWGTVYAGNLTPDPETGLGAWNSAEFWRAMHHGVSRDGRLLTPAFPYPQFTHITRVDSDALHAYLRSLPPVHQPNRAHQLRYPANTAWAVAVWRGLYFTAGDGLQPSSPPDATTEWVRGAYLVQGLGHCAACHTPRDALGGPLSDGRNGLGMVGSVMPDGAWYAPSLHHAQEGGVAQWTTDQVVQLLKTGQNPLATTLGPMAEVVFRSTQHMTDADLIAVATYLRTLPTSPTTANPRTRPAPAAVLTRGESLYDKHCASCHGQQGEGAGKAYLPLAGNRTVTMNPPTNVIQAVMQGGFAPATAGNPRPYGMPPFQHVLSTEDLAAVVSFVRQAWGNQGDAVSTVDVDRVQSAAR